MLPWWIQVLHFSRDDSIFSIFYMKVEEQEYAKMLYIVFLHFSPKLGQTKSKNGLTKMTVVLFSVQNELKSLFFHFLKISIRFLFFCAWRWTIRNIQKSFILIGFFRAFSFTASNGVWRQPLYLIKSCLLGSIVLDKYTPLEKGHELNVDKIFRRCQVHLLNVLHTFNLLPVFRVETQKYLEALNFVFCWLWSMQNFVFW